MTALRDAALTSKAWPFEEARKIVKRYEKADPAKGYVLFQTGYGPSGLPHIGTFGEVARTTMVRRAFQMISDIPTRLLCFSDDMDGFRKVPGNVPSSIKHSVIIPKLSPFAKAAPMGRRRTSILTKPTRHSMYKGRIIPT